MKNFPVIIILANGHQTSNLDNLIFNKNHSRIANAQSTLNSNLNKNETSTIYLIEATNEIYTIYPNGTKHTF
jgi:hypothetical protein